MPRVSAFFGIVIEMYFGDHPPPHFHARHGDEVATIEISSAAVIKGSLSPRTLRLVREWVAEHRDELNVNFDRVVNRQAPTPIEPLK